MQATYSAKELLSLQLPCLPGTVRGIQLRADREKWAGLHDTVRGGAQKRFISHVLPDEIRTAILTMEKIDALVPSPGTLPAPADDDLRDLDEGRMAMAQAKGALLKLYLQALASAPWGKKDERRDEFMAAYNSSLSHPTLHAQIGVVSWKTIEGWKSILKKYRGDVLRLADSRGYAKKGKVKITREEMDVLVGVVQSPLCRNTPKSELIVTAKGLMRKRGIIPTVGNDTYRRALDKWIETSYDKWVFWHLGEGALDDDVLPHTERDYDQIEVGDALIADGHVLNFTITNPWNGKAQRMMLVAWLDMKSMMPVGWEISPTEDVKAISNALRRAILYLGKLPKVAYFDNGRAFKAKYFTGDFTESGEPGLYERLGIETIIARPYKARSKTIERFFKRFGSLERRCLSYVGTDVANKPAHMDRGEKLLRELHQKITGGKSPTLIEAYEAVACWFYEYGMTPKERGRLKGVKPLELLKSGMGPGVDEASLRLLMTARKDVTIRANGVKVTPDGPWFNHPGLYGRRHKATVRYDMQGADSVLVYDQDGSLICEATPVGKVHPLAKLGTDEDRAELSRQLEQVERLRKTTVGAVKEFMGEKLLDEVQQQIDDREPKQAGGKSLQRKKVVQITAEDRARAQAEADETSRLQREMEAAQLATELENMTEFDRYDRLLEMEMRGDDLDSTHRGFMRYYEQTPEYERDRDYWETRRTGLALMYGQKEKAADEAAAGA